MSNEPVERLQSRSIRVDGACITCRTTVCTCIPEPVHQAAPETMNVTVNIDLQGAAVMGGGSWFGSERMNAPMVKSYRNTVKVYGNRNDWFLSPPPRRAAWQARCSTSPTERRHSMTDIRKDEFGSREIDRNDAAGEISRAFEAQAFVVDRPWGDGDWIVLGSPDPHQATIVADCSMIDDTQGEELPYTNQEAAAEIARRWNALPDECERRNAYAAEVMRLEALLDQRETIQTQECRQLLAALGSMKADRNEWRDRANRAIRRGDEAVRELNAYKSVIEEVRKCYDLGTNMPAPVEVAFARCRTAAWRRCDSGGGADQ